MEFNIFSDSMVSGLCMYASTWQGEISGCAIHSYWLVVVPTLNAVCKNVGVRLGFSNSESFSLRFGAAGKIWGKCSSRCAGNFKRVYRLCVSFEFVNSFWQNDFHP